MDRALSGDIDGLVKIDVDRTMIRAEYFRLDVTALDPRPKTGRAKDEIDP